MFQKIKILPVLLVFLIVSCVKNSPSVLPDKELNKLQAEMHHQFQAMVEGDVETLEGIYSDDYVITSRKGALLEKADWIQMLTSGRLKYLRIGERIEVNINLYGNVAVVKGLMGSTVFMLDGEKFETGPRRFTAVWVYERGSWRQVTRHHTALAKENDEPEEKEVP